MSAIMTSRIPTIVPSRPVRQFDGFALICDYLKTREQEARERASIADAEKRLGVATAKRGHLEALLQESMRISGVDAIVHGPAFQQQAVVLVGGFLHALKVGHSSELMDPTSVIDNPAIAAHAATDLSLIDGEVA